MSELSELQSLLKSADPSIQQYVVALKAENAKLQKKIIQLEAKDVSAQNRIAALEVEVKERGPKAVNDFLNQIGEHYKIP